MTIKLKSYAAALNFAVISHPTNKSSEEGKEVPTAKKPILSPPPRVYLPGAPDTLCCPGLGWHPTGTFSLVQNSALPCFTTRKCLPMERHTVQTRHACPARRPTREEDQRGLGRGQGWSPTRWVLVISDFLMLLSQTLR